MPRRAVVAQDVREGATPPDAPRTLTAAEYRALNQRGNKYRAVKVEEDGFTFASKREAARYRVLKLRLIAGEIRALHVHPSWSLEVNGAHIGNYSADFAYESDAGYVVEDVKSKATRTEAYRLRKKLMWACHKINIVEV